MDLFHQTQRAHVCFFSKNKINGVEMDLRMKWILFPQNYYYFFSFKFYYSARFARENNYYLARFARENTTICARFAGAQKTTMSEASLFTPGFGTVE